eukprot:TRINITY_DN14307_c0_g1_i2.p1 TRINITY_DN14307_c0_g1~~TRINITY_DN14307_c0_g1_i2.p1  ORF type:complete len:533 (-),score=179.69 TRINITY_DN14307_c0_g1_i2:38-1636(-)
MEAVDTSEGETSARRHQYKKFNQDLRSRDKKSKCISTQDNLLAARTEGEAKVEADKSSFYDSVMEKNRSVKSIKELYAMCESISTTVKDSYLLPEIVNDKQAAKALLKGSQSVAALRKTSQFTESLSNNLLTGRREPARIAIEKSREILLAKLRVQDKLRETQRVKEYIERKESLLKLNKELYEQDKKMVEDYIDYAKKEAVVQKFKTAGKTVEREKKLEELTELRNEQIRLKKKLDESKEEYRVLIEYKDFMLQLDPSLKKQLKHNNFFMTQDDPEHQTNEGGHKDEFEAEIPVNFTSPEEVLSILYTLERKSLSMIYELQKREEELEKLHKETEFKMQAKKARLEKIREGVMHAAIKETRRRNYLNRLQETATIKEHQDRQTIRDTKKLIEDIIKSIHYEYVDGKRRSEGKRMTSLQQLEEITGLLLRLKEIRVYRVNKALRKKGPEDLFAREEAERKRMQEADMAEKHRAMAEEQQRKKLESKKWDNITRTRKTLKEMMRRIRLSKTEKKAVSQEKEEVDDPFNDKYFI